MTTVQIFGRSRNKFEQAFPDAKFEGYECNARYCYFRFIKKMSDNTIKKICEVNKIKYSIV